MIKGKRIVWISGIVGAIYAIILFLLGIMSFSGFGNWFFSLGGSYYSSLRPFFEMPIFFPIEITNSLVIIIFFILGILNDSSSIQNAILVEKIIYPLIIIILWFFIGILIGKLISKISYNRGKTK